MTNVNQLTRRAGKGAVGALTLALALSACGSSSSSKPTDSSDGGSKLSATLNGSGSTFQKSLQEVAIDAFQKANSGVKVNYAGGGSSKGKADLANKAVDFAGTDSQIKPEEEASFEGRETLYFPIAAGPITVAYKLPGVDKLQLSPETLADIFQAKITKWNDAAIAKDNAGVSLPSTSITIVHRAEGSGTTSNFTKYLLAAAPNWKLDKGETINWPANSQAGQGNAGVAQTVSSTEGAIGYIDFSDATQASLSTAAIKNASGEFIAPSLDAASKAIAGAEIADNLTYNPLNSKGAGAYPITAPTWVLVDAKQADKAKGDALKAYLEFLLTDGQKLASQAYYAPLPSDLATKAIAQLDKLQIG